MAAKSRPASGQPEEPPAAVQSATLAPILQRLDRLILIADSGFDGVSEYDATRTLKRTPLTRLAALGHLIDWAMTHLQWIARARSEMRPPMPWFNLAAMTDDDLKAMYRYVRSLGPKGTPAPDYAAPGQAVNTPYFVFVPQNLPPKTAGR